MLDCVYVHVCVRVVWYNILASLWLAISITCFLGRHDPVKFSAVFVVQMIYKIVWLVTTVLPGLMAKNLSTMNQFAGVVMLSYIVLDVLYIPWGYLFAKEKTRGD